MRRSLLALLRGPDGRSLAWALALLLALNTFAAGAHIGSTGNDGAGTVFCSLAGGQSGNGQAPADHTEPCCFAGCVMHVTGLAGPEIAVPVPPVLPKARAPLPAASIAVGGQWAPTLGARGPPSLV